MVYFLKIDRTNNKTIRKNNLGSSLEKDINLTNIFYREQKIAFIHKNEIPIQVVKVEYPNRQKAKIVEAYYKFKSLPDYQGIYKGKYLSFDVKETNNPKYFNLSNIPQHQIYNLQEVQKLKGISFFIINFKTKNKYFYLPINYLTDFLNNSSKKSISYDIFEQNFFMIPFRYNPRLDYLKIVDKFIQKD
ncbi:Holliday junction resolvase RecU [Candidatus Phytoplasma melaleucae]|uniref:Holliday junction resolvase RecU n=1 Tax=Candidatus Phytoplasma melaleucae TaxID=2982630 RepID=A0ABT9DCQ4_9MOLU|nr:Holliday junction resolvase RecU ['Melaleuca sp.' phytoplasma]MDO8167907.1 Holliday junction resolvase RecU ['Melaleuca sp.' phytoplasma]MDV3205185.1 Holliday junction resolvase RecU [Weeping tea tree witches'-broom phytoplasma]